MKLDTERLTSEPTPFAFEADQAWWDAQISTQLSPPEALFEPVQVAGEIYRGGDGQELVLEGRVRGQLDLECARCLARYRHELLEPFRLVLEPAGARTPAEPEAAEALARDGLCTTDELELGWYQGSQIHLDAFCVEVIALALPVKALCREDCAGLCPRCGTDRNEAPCQCDDVAPNSPFAVLATLRGGQK